jgi:threonine 3-dehydrogenase
MKALVKRESAPGLWMEEVPLPTVGDHEVLIKTKKTSICGTDLHIYKWDAWAQKTIRVPMVIGHEFMGTIVEVGEQVRGPKIGERVTGEGHVTCGACPGCLTGKRHLCMYTQGLGVQRHGCFAEYFTLPAENIFPLPTSISDELGAIFDPFGNAMHTALSADLTGEDVLITGAGPIGCMAVAIARKAGARYVVITDINDYRLQLALKLGATNAINVKKESLTDTMKTLGIDNGFTVGMEMSGNPEALRTLLETAQPGATISLLGILPPDCEINWDLVIFKMLKIEGIYGREIFGTWFKMTHMLESGLNLDPVITHRFSANDFEQGFQTLLTGNSGKIILDWSE